MTARAASALGLALRAPQFLEAHDYEIFAPTCNKLKSSTLEGRIISGFQNLIPTHVDRLRVPATLFRLSPTEKANLKAETHKAIRQAVSEANAASRLEECGLDQNNVLLPRMKIR